MSLLTTAEHRRQRLLRRLLLATAALLVVVATTVTVTLLVVDRATAPIVEDAEISPPQGSAVAEGSGAAADGQAGIWQTPPVSAGPLILPRPTGSQRGIPVGFPHTTEGAISAAAHYAQVSVGLDLDTARALGEVAGAPSYIDAAEHFVQATRTARESLGVTASGDAGAYLTFTAQAYLVTDAAPDRVVVAILGTGDGAGPVTQGQGRQVHSATSYSMVWVDGDWHIAAGKDLDSVPTPRSPQAYEQGWRDLAIA